MNRPTPARPSSLAQALYRREILPWTLGGFALGLVEGATAAVLVKRGFTGHAAPEVLNLAVAFVSGSPAISNMTSFAWANLAHPNILPIHDVNLYTEYPNAITELAPNGSCRRLINDAW